MAEYVTKEQVIENVIGQCNLILVNDLENIPNADVIERSTMKMLCNEYLSKCNCCDECCAEYFCIENQLRTEKRDCVNNLITYFVKRNIGE